MESYRLSGISQMRISQAETANSRRKNNPACTGISTGVTAIVDSASRNAELSSIVEHFLDAAGQGGEDFS